MVIDLTAPIREWMPIVVYPGYADELPDIWLGRFPPGAPRPFKSWIVENPSEAVPLETALSKPITMSGGAVNFKAGPDRVVRRSSHYKKPIAALYVPPEDGWPYIALYRWPREVGQSINAERGVYTWDTFPHQDAAIDALSRVAVLLGVAGWIRPPDKPN